MTDRDHIKTLYQLLEFMRDNYERSAIRTSNELEELRTSKKSLHAIMARLNIQQDIFETYDAFIADSFEEDLSGNNIDSNMFIMAYKEWSRFNPGRKILNKTQITALLQLSPISNKRIKRSHAYAPTLDM